MNVIPEPSLIPQKEFHISINKDEILLAYQKRGFINRTQHHILNKELRKIEGNMNRLKHIQSIIEKALLKTLDVRKEKHPKYKEIF